jgi:2-hydroxy-6-oxonona-2,4-dienedioate hydrolase
MMSAPTGRLISRYCRLPDGEIHYRISSGEAPPARIPVVLVHREIVSSTYMIPLGEHLAPSFRVYAPDLPGYGDSYKPQRFLNVAELADALAEWHAAMALPPAHFISNSFGCNVLVEFAIRHPERVERLVLQGTPTEPGARGILTNLIRWQLNGHRQPKGMGEIQKVDYRKAGIRRGLYTFKLQRTHPVEQRLPHVRQPTLAVHGTRDPITPVRWGEQIARLLPNARLAVLPGLTHTINFYFPLELTRIARPFLLEAQAQAQRQAKAQ